MFVLKRHQGQRVTFAVEGVEFSLTVHEIDRNHVRLAFDAPRKVVIDRAEAKRRGLRLVA